MWVLCWLRQRGSNPLPTPPPAQTDHDDPAGEGHVSGGGGEQFGGLALVGGFLCMLLLDQLGGAAHHHHSHAGHGSMAGSDDDPHKSAAAAAAAAHHHLPDPVGGAAPPDLEVALLHAGGAHPHGSAVSSSGTLAEEGARGGAARARGAWLGRRARRATALWDWRSVRCASCSCLPC